MALGTRLTIGDYIGTRKRADLSEWKRDLLKGANSSHNKSFSAVFSTCIAGQKTTGLTIADYLANPVRPRTCSTRTSVGPPPGLKPKEGGKSEGKAYISSEAPNVGNQREMRSESAMDQSIRKNIANSIEKAARKYDLPSDLIKGVIKAESGFQVRAESSAGALGLMQLMPATAEELGVKDPFDIGQNIEAGTQYLRKMMDRFGNDLKKALAAYNAGPGTVEKYAGNVPYKETRQYVERVLKFAGLTA